MIASDFSLHLNVSFLTGAAILQKDGFTCNNEDEAKSYIGKYGNCYIVNRSVAQLPHFQVNQEITMMKPIILPIVTRRVSYPKGKRLVSYPQNS
jgi:hypothetical protein